MALDKWVLRRIVTAERIAPAPWGRPTVSEACERACRDEGGHDNAQRWALDHFARTRHEPFDACFTVTPERLGRAGHGLHDVMHVAQSQYHDIAVARQRGQKVCWIERRAGKPIRAGRSMPPSPSRTTASPP